MNSIVLVDSTGKCKINGQKTQSKKSMMTVFASFLLVALWVRRARKKVSNRLRMLWHWMQMGNYNQHSGRTRSWRWYLLMLLEACRQSNRRNMTRWRSIARPWSWIKLVSRSWTWSHLDVLATHAMCSIMWVSSFKCNSEQKNWFFMYHVVVKCSQG